MTAYIIPVIILIIMVFGLIKEKDIFTPFLEGANEGLKVTVEIFPNILGIMVAIHMLKASGAIAMLSVALEPLLSKVGFPPEIIPLALLRPISGSGSLGIVNDILKTYGTDSHIGRIASVMMGSTETTFYTVALYFAAAKVTNIRHSLKAAIVADIVGIIGSVVVCGIFFGG